MLQGEILEERVSKPSSQHQTQIPAQYRIVPAGPEDTHQVVNLFHEAYNGAYCYGECKDSDKLTELISNPSNIWFLAKDSSGQIIASAAGIATGDRVELGKTAVLHKYRKEGIAKKLCEHVRDELLRRETPVIWATIRNEPMHKTSLNDGLTLVGYFPGSLKFDYRELHLMSMRLSKNAATQRIAPDHNLIYDLPAVRHILSALQLDNAVGEYPIVSATPNQSVEQRESFIFAGLYSAENNSISIDTIPKSMPAYLQTTVLADKIEQIVMLTKLGFRMTAFLPAWYSNSSQRYDCVVMTNPLSSYESMEYMRKQASELEAGFTLDC